MKKAASLLLILVSLTCAASQGDTAKVYWMDEIYFGASITSGFSYRYLTVNDGLAGSSIPAYKAVISERNAAEKPDFAYTGGLRLGFKFTKVVSLETGVDYSRRQYSVPNSAAPAGFISNGQIVSYADRSIVNYTFHYIGVPLAVNFTLGKNRLQGLITSGIMLDCLLEQVQTYRLYDEDDKLIFKKSQAQITPYNAFNLSPFIGAGVQYTINHLAFIRVMPMAQMQTLTNINAPINEYIWSVGVNTSVYFGIPRFEKLLKKHTIPRFQ